GYEPAFSVNAERVGATAPDEEIDRYLACSQVSYHKTDGYGLQHALDIHWKTSVPPAFATALPADALTAGAVPVLLLGSRARAFGPAHALAIACIHRLAHHHGDERLIWLYDIHLLAGSLGRDDAREYVRLAADREIGAICEDGVCAARQTFGTVLPDGLLEGLQAVRSRSTRERTAVYVRRR